MGNKTYPFMAESLTTWIIEHRNLALLVIFLVAFLESLAVIGIFVPGASLLFGAATLGGSGALPIIPTLVVSTLGAFGGDAVSYWLGYHYRDHLKKRWPITRYPNLMAEGEKFFEKHGGKSILFGRFAGPLRAIIPVVAGMAGMNYIRFTLINFFSAIAWSATFLLPGFLFGASLEIASEIGGRLVVLLVIAVVVIWLSFYLVRRILKFLQPRANQILLRLLTFSQAYPRIRILVSSIIDPDQPEITGLISWALLLIVTTTLFFILLTEALGGILPTDWDQSIYYDMQSLRIPWADDIFIFLLQSTTLRVLLPCSAIVLLYLLIRRQWLTAAHWLAALAFAVLAPLLLSLVIQFPSTPIKSAVLNELTAFPNIQSSLSMVFFGFLTVIITRHWPSKWRYLPYSALSLLLIAVFFARIYLGINWFTEVAGGFMLGFIWVMIVGIAYRRHIKLSNDWRGLSLTALLSLALFSSLPFAETAEKDLALYTFNPKQIDMPLTTWWENQWRTLPPYRVDIIGQHKHPLTLQYHGELSTLAAALQQQGWRESHHFEWKNTLLWFGGALKLEQFPILPQVHNGKRDVLSLYYSLPNQTAWVLRLWPTNIRIEGDKPAPLWIGNVSKISVKHIASWLFYPSTEKDFNSPLAALKNNLGGFSMKEVSHKNRLTKKAQPPPMLLLISTSPVANNE